MRYRIVLIALQALIPGIAASFFWLPMTGDWYLPAPVSWLLVAAAGVAWLKLADRAWQESVTLTPDMLVVRNVFRTRRLPLADVTGARFRYQSSLVISVTGQPAPSGPGHASRHAAGRPAVVAAVKLGAAHWSGRRIDADEIADAIVIAAGLPPLRPREEIVSRRQAWIRLPAGIAILVLATAVDPASQSLGLIPSAGQFVGQGLSAVATLLLIPASLATLDRLLRPWRDRDTRKPGQAPDTP